MTEISHYDILDALDDIDTAKSDLNRAVDALYAIRDMHAQAVDGLHLVCDRCGCPWPCDHVAVLRWVGDLL